MAGLPEYKSNKLAQLTRAKEVAELKIKSLKAEVERLERMNQLRQHQIADILDGDK